MASRKESCCDQVIPTNAARPFKQPAAVLKKNLVQEILSKNQGRTVLEIGGGCLRNSRYLQGLGFKIHVLEVKGIEDRFGDLQDQKTIDAVVRNLEIIGEAVRWLPTEFKDRQGSVPWPQIAGMRNRIVHDYFGLDLEIIWQVLQTSLPEFKRQLASIPE